MPHKYTRTTGLWEQSNDSQLWLPIARCYSGHGEGLNNPLLERIHNVGPIPAGMWRMEDLLDTATHGPAVIPLKPAPETDTYTRSGFLTHGDRMHGPRFQASLGCIVTLDGLGGFAHNPLHARQFLGDCVNRGDFWLEVI